MMHKLFGKHSMRKRSQPEKKSIKTDTVVSQRTVYNQIASAVWETANSVHKLTTDKPQPVLINVLIRATRFHKVV